jgi:Fe-S-cluster-containing dehydrogenase component
MAKYGFAIDITKCTGCHNCFVACKDEFAGNDYLPYSAAQPREGQDWIRLQEVEQGSGTKIKVDYIPILCQHCEDPLCMKKGPEGAVYRRDDGIVIIDPVKAKGCKELVNSCPYKVIFWNEEKQLPQKCTMCVHMLDKGEKTTRCAESCPTGALLFGDLDDPNSEVSKFIAEKGNALESFKPQYDTVPGIKYFSLPRPFIAGEVLLSDKTNECVKGAKVTLSADGKVLVETETDFFGDFEFNNLELNKEYTISAEYEGYRPEKITVKTNASKNVGEIVLQAR